MFRRRRVPAAPSWPGPHGDRSRVLVEDPDGANQWAIHRALTKAGFDVATCDGPTSFPDGRCPLVEHGSCALVDGADVIYNALPLREADSRILLRTLRRRAPLTPVLVEAPIAQADLWPDTLRDCTVVGTPASALELAELLRQSVPS